MNHAYLPQQNHPPPASPGLAQQAPRRPPVQRPGITTTLTAAQRFGPRLQAQTPSSPRPGITPVSPFSHLPVSSFSPSLASPMASARTSVSSTAAYNPQEWAQHGSRPGSHASPSASGPVRRVGGRGEVTGMEAALPSPPPPYSASPQSMHPSSRGLYPSPNAPSFSSQTTSPTNYASEYNTPVSAATSVSPGDVTSSIHRSMSTEPSSSASTVQQSTRTAYLPPPPVIASERDRSTSRARFTLASITGRSRPTSSASPANATDTLQQQTTAVLLQSSQLTYFDHASPAMAPTARRAASTGCIGAPAGPGRRSQPGTPAATDEPANYGFALPPPPPGPPPALRSQSLSRVGELAADGNEAFAAAAGIRATLRSNRLGPIPPTPVGWVEEDGAQEATSPLPLTPQRWTAQPSHVAFAGPHMPPQLADPLPSHKSIAFNPSNDSAPRDSSANRGIRERRSESRASRARSESREPLSRAIATPEPSSGSPDLAKPANLVLGSANGAISRRRHVSKAKISPLLDGRLSPHLQRARVDSDVTSSSQPNSGSLPPDSSSARDSAPVTPFPGKKKLDLTIPAPWSAASPSRGKQPALIVRSASASASQLHSPIPRHAKLDNESRNFVQASIDRHRHFVDQEAKAKSDQERLQLFANYIVHESRVRRDRYSEAFDALGTDVLDLTRDLWRTDSQIRRNKTPTPSSGQYTPNRRASDESRLHEPSSASSASNNNSATFTPTTEPDSPRSPARPGRTEPRSSFQPMLSPIPSMAMSSIADDEGSRGRASSRWWEASTDAQSIGGTGRVYRTKREQKYMGVPREAREKLQWTIPEHSPGMPSSSLYNPYAGLGPDEYPSEKTGWHEEPVLSPANKTFTPRTPDIPRLDVSRLITLPPPYPRHHPAVNNKHPDLASLRGILRSLNDREENTSIRDKGASEAGIITPGSDAAAELAERRRKYRRDIQHQINQGRMSFSEAAKQEATFEVIEAKRVRDETKSAFERFQVDVVAPLNTLHSQKINQATASITQLTESLSYEAESHNPNQIQEEGDEQPEMLEKLTLMKWFHEAQEQVHKDQFDLEGESNDKYRAVILMPYRQARNPEKVKEVDAFFIKDAKDRKADYDKKALKRFTELLRVMEKHAMRGVEVQLSAFWDIAPELLAVVQKVPSNLNGFDILIPPQEYDENPAYSDFPLQYLYSLLLHAEKSAYQFIESQTNLLCLLHEAKTSVMLADCRLTKSQRCATGEDPDDVQRLTERIQRDEDASLTVDLKERVQLVEDQWREALGAGLKKCQERIKVHLEELGGFDDLDEE